MSSLPDQIHAVSTIGAPPHEFLVTIEHRLLHLLVSRALDDIEADKSTLLPDQIVAGLDREQRQYEELVDFLKTLER